MDPFSTPQRFRSSLSFPTGEIVRISKATIVTMIENTDFESIFLPGYLVTDDPEVTIQFFEALGQELVTTLIKKSPPKTSPHKLVTPERFEQETPTKTSLLGVGDFVGEEKSNYSNSIQSKPSDLRQGELTNPFEGEMEKEIFTNSKRKKILEGLATKSTKGNVLPCFVHTNLNRS